MQTQSKSSQGPIRGSLSPRIKLCIFHGMIFILEIVLLISLVVGCPENRFQCYKLKRAIERYIWNIMILKYIYLFISLKSLLTRNVYGYRLSIALTFHNCILGTLTCLCAMNGEEDFESITIAVVFILVSTLEFTLSILYLVVNKVELEFIKFKKTGPCLRNIAAYRAIQIIEYVSLTDFAFACAQVFDSAFIGSMQVAMVSLVEFLMSSMIGILMKIGFGHKESDLKKYMLILLVAGVCTNASMTVFLLTKVDVFEIWYAMALSVYGSTVRMIMRLVMLYWMIVYARMSVSQTDQDNLLNKRVLHI